MLTDNAYTTFLINIACTSCKLVRAITVLSWEPCLATRRNGVKYETNKFPRTEQYGKQIKNNHESDVS